VLRSDTGRSIRDHPACKIELANRAAVVKWLTQLGLTRVDVRRGAGWPTLW
jgi:hypothetical protein